MKIFAIQQMRNEKTNFTKTEQTLKREVRIQSNGALKKLSLFPIVRFEALIRLEHLIEAKRLSVK